MKRSRFLPALCLALGLLALPYFAGPAGGQSSSEETDPAQIRKDLNELVADLREQQRLIIRKLEAIEDRLRELEEPGPGAVAGSDADAEASLDKVAGEQVSGEPALDPPEPEDAEAVATVCREGCAFTDLQAAVKAAAEGDTVTVAPGLYGMCAVIQKSLRLKGLRDEAGKRAHLGGGACEGKGPLVVRAPKVIIEGFEISNVSVPDRNGACVRVDPATKYMVIRDIYCHDSETGILAHLNDGVISIEDSRFERNGADKGRAHGLYVGRAESLTIRNTQILSTKGAGQSLKSAAQRTLVEDSVIAALDGLTSRAIDFFGGGELVVRRSVIQQGPNSENSQAIGIALEPARLNPEPHSTVIENNWIIFDDPERCCWWLLQAKQFGPFTVRGNKIVGMADVNMPSIETEVMAKNEIFEKREEAGLPSYDGTIGSLPRPGGF